MYVRLAFAVAAHLEPEILVVDEVLAVGDAEFQREMLGQDTKEVSMGGRTVLFVSHNMAADPEPVQHGDLPEARAVGNTRPNSGSHKHLFEGCRIRIRNRILLLAWTVKGTERSATHDST